jgi:hypothetical protein
MDGIHMTTIRIALASALAIAATLAAGAEAYHVAAQHGVTAAVHVVAGGGMTADGTGKPCCD